MGDMNYRLDPLFAQDVFPISMSRDEIWNKIVGLTDKGSEGYAMLHKADELDKYVEKALLCYCCCYCYCYYYARCCCYYARCSRCRDHRPAAPTALLLPPPCRSHRRRTPLTPPALSGTSCWTPW